MTIIDRIDSAAKTVLKDLYQLDNAEIKIERTNANFNGDFTLVVFPFLRYSKKGPEQTAQELGEKLSENMPEISGFNVVKGFLNIECSDNSWIEILKETSANGVSLPTPATKRKVVIEYSSPNTNKPLHLGHIRNNVLGFAMANILEANGHDVIKTNLVNDRGVHICKSMLAWQKFGNGETPESSGIKGDHLVGKYYVEFDKAYKQEVKELIEAGRSEEEAKEESNLMKEVREMLVKWEEGDNETVSLWKTMNSWVYKGFEQTYTQLGVAFDTIYYESDTYLLGKEIVKEGLDKGVFYTKDNGSVWVDLSDEGLDEKLLLRADGTSVYITQDIGTAKKRYEEFKMDQSVYVVGNEQDYHFKVLQLILKKLDYPFWEGIYHLSYGMVDLPSGKMKSREGTVVDADDLMNEMVRTAKEQTEELGKTEGMSDEELSSLYSMLGLGALKYFLLRVDAKNRMLFDPKESIDFQGNTGPFVQYTHTRIASILSASDDHSFARPSSLEEEEKELIMQLLYYPQVIEESGRTFNPSVVANASFELAKSYNRFYHQHSILGAEDKDIRQFRIALSAAVGAHLKHAFGLLGIAVPERM